MEGIPDDPKPQPLVSPDVPTHVHEVEGGLCEGTEESGTCHTTTLVGHAPEEKSPPPLPPPFDGPRVPSAQQGDIEEVLREPEPAVVSARPRAKERWPWDERRESTPRKGAGAYGGLRLVGSPAESVLYDDEDFARRRTLPPPYRSDSHSDV